MNRPKIICHMVQSLDGKVTGDFLSLPQVQPAVDLYYEINRRFRADAFACGRVTMEESFTGGKKPDLAAFRGIMVPKEDHVAATPGFYAVSFDRKGRLGWSSFCIEDEDPGYGGAHIIEVVHSPEAEYLAYLQHVGVSYIFAQDPTEAVEKLYRLFGIKTLLLEGGSVLNGAFLRAGLVDELSLVVAPVLAEAEDAPLFDNSIFADFSRVVTEERNGVLWLNYKKR